MNKTKNCIREPFFSTARVYNHDKINIYLDDELDGILDELDEDGSGSMDFDEFCEMMMTKPE